MKNVDQGKDEQVDVTRTNIAWASDIEYSFKNIEGQGNWEDIQWLDMTDGK